MTRIFELYAIRYARRPSPEELPVGAVAEKPMDYFIWLARSDEHAVVIDAGFTDRTAITKGRIHLRSPLDTLRALGVEPEAVKTVILSHLHFDHTGYVDQFPNASYVLQDREMSFWTGRHAHKNNYVHLVNADDLTYLVRANLTGRIAFVNGDATLMDGLSVHWVGGHTAGQQVVRVRTAAGHAVLTSDAVHFYQEIEQEELYGVVHHIPEVYDSFARINELADRADLIVAGHDPLVRQRYEPLTGEFEGFVWQIGRNSR